MTEQQWLSCGDPMEMLRYLLDGQHGHGRHPIATDRKLRLFACACCRSLWDKLVIPSGRACVEVAERFADDQGTPEELEAARAKAFADNEGTSSNTAWENTEHAAVSTWATVRLPTVGMLPMTGANLLRDIIGNPFHPVVREDDYLTDPAVQQLATTTRRDGEKNCLDRIVRHHWLTRDVISTAQGVYEERIMPDGHLDPVCLAILADALEEAGCPERLPCRFCKGKKYVRLETGGALKCDCVEIDQHPILPHLRSPGPHVRGCWAVDLILGKE